MNKYFTFLIILLLSNIGFSQTAKDKFLDDSAMYCDKYVTPGTEAAVYIANTNWMTSAKKNKLYTVTVSLHSNLFFIPNSGREFDIKNSDFKFFHINDLSSTPIVGNETVVTVPTVFGGDKQYYLAGDLGGNQVKLLTPKGIGKEVVFYPFAEASIALWKGFEVTGRYAPRISYQDKIEYKIAGGGLKYNISQHFKKMEAKKIYCSTLVTYSTEEVTSNFIESTSQFGTLGFNKITSSVNTWSMQLSVSKEWRKWEFILSSINSRNHFEYVLSGPRGTIEDVIPIQSLLNEKLKDIYKTNFNSMGELSARYDLKHFHLQTAISFGKYLNSSMSLQYHF
jgi:hypothetical protein